MNKITDIESVKPFAVKWSFPKIKLLTSHHTQLTCELLLHCTICCAADRPTVVDATAVSDQMDIVMLLLGNL